MPAYIRWREDRNEIHLKPVVKEGGDLRRAQIKRTRPTSSDSSPTLRFAKNGGFVRIHWRASRQWHPKTETPELGYGGSTTNPTCLLLKRWATRRRTSALKRRHQPRDQHADDGNQDKQKCLSRRCEYEPPSASPLPIGLIRRFRWRALLHLPVALHCSTVSRSMPCSIFSQADGCGGCVVGRVRD